MKIITKTRTFDVEEKWLDVKRQLDLFEWVKVTERYLPSSAAEVCQQREVVLNKNQIIEIWP